MLFTFSPIEILRVICHFRIFFIASLLTFGYNCTFLSVGCSGSNGDLYAAISWQQYLYLLLLQVYFAGDRHYLSRTEGIISKELIRASILSSPVWGSSLSRRIAMHRHLPRSLGARTLATKIYEWFSGSSHTKSWHIYTLA